MNLPQLSLGGATLGDQLYEALESAIIAGELAPGERIQPDDIAEHFGVSRIPVREAMRALDANGWVTIRPRHGVYVRERTLRELEEMFDVRGALEGMAASRATERASGDQIAELRRLADRGQELTGRPSDFARHNTEFHDLVVQVADNDVLARVLALFRKRVQWYFQQVAPVRSHESSEEHAALVDAMAAGNSDEAASLARSHVMHTLNVLRTQFPDEDDEDGQAVDAAEEPA